MAQYYLCVVWGGVDPHVFGPLDGDEGLHKKLSELLNAPEDALDLEGPDSAFAIFGSDPDGAPTRLTAEAFSNAEVEALMSK